MFNSREKYLDFLTLIAALIIAIAILSLIFFTHNAKIDFAPSCASTSVDKTYLKNGSSCVINFMCIQGEQAFRDQCGCGCQKVNVATQVQPEGTLCTPAQKKGNLCTMEYAPTCGWFDPAQIQCLKYPCAQTFSNPCTACHNVNVVSYTQGECPK